MVEHGFRKAEVVGSNPTPGSITSCRSPSAGSSPSSARSCISQKVFRSISGRRNRSRRNHPKSGTAPPDDDAGRGRSARRGLLSAQYLLLERVHVVDVLRFLLTLHPAPLAQAGPRTFARPLQEILRTERSGTQPHTAFTAANRVPRRSGKRGLSLSHRAAMCYEIGMPPGTVRRCADVPDSATRMADYATSSFGFPPGLSFAGRALEATSLATASMFCGRSRAAMPCTCRPNRRLVR